MEGDGPIAEIPFTGTGFFLESGDLVTNRHVALPWESNTNSAALKARGHEPVLQKLIAYLPGQKEAIALKLVGTSDDADLAILRGQTPLSQKVNGLKLAKKQPEAGEEIILMGYSAGLRSILAQSGVAFIKKLQEDGNLDFWNVAARLAADGLISPLASRGIVGKVGNVAVVYDAETTHGGSGGPVLNLRGEVIAVNMAILPEFGGSNLGVPADNVRTLVEATKVSLNNDPPVQTGEVGNLSE
jgi:S1-C subfamily serine protease